MKLILIFSIGMLLLTCSKKEVDKTTDDPQTEEVQQPVVESEEPEEPYMEEESPVEEIEEISAECMGSAKEDCICTAHVDPVCGCNGVTYTNSCKAECAGVLEYDKGPCK